MMFSELNDGEMFRIVRQSGSDMYCIKKIRESSDHNAIIIDCVDHYLNGMRANFHPDDDVTRMVCEWGETSDDA